MAIEKILSISGKPGLYQLQTQTRGGFLAESLLDGKRISVSARHNVSLLSEIAVYTLTEEKPLREVFKLISEKEDGGQAISHKEPKIKLEEYFFEVLPDYDEDRVYASDIKKIIQWYNLLQKNEITDFSEPEEKTEEVVEAVKKADPKTPKAAKVSTTKATSVAKGGSAKNTAARKK